MGMFTTDANGIVTEGKYAGRHISEVERYLLSLEEAVYTGGTPAPAAAPPAGGTPPAPAAPKTPEQELAERGGNRVTGLENLAAVTANRLEQDDEAAAKAKFSDYSKYEEKINALKKNSPIHARTQRGYHEQAYFFIKTQDPEVQRILGGGAPASEQPPEPPASPSAEPGAPPATPPAPASAPPVAPPPPVVPAAVPPPGRVAAQPTPHRQPPAPPKVPKLKGNAKTERIARAFGKTHEAFLLSLEAEGVTQDTLEAAMAARGNQQEGGQQRRRSVYDE